MDFTDWYKAVSGFTCSIEFEYQTMESISGQQTSNLALTDPTSLSLSVGIETSDTSLADVDHTVTVFAMSPS